MSDKHNDIHVKATTYTNSFILILICLQTMVKIAHRVYVVI